MARIRSIKPDYWKSEKLASRLPGPEGRETRRMFIGLWNLAEDHGVLRGNPAYIRAELYPYDDDVTTEDVGRRLGMLERGGFIRRFGRDGSTYLWICGFEDHQRINRPSKPSLPEPSDEEMDAWREDSLSAHGVLTDDSREINAGGGGEVEVEKEGEPANAASTGVAALQALWNRLAEGLPGWSETGKKRKAAAKARLKERPGLDYWERVIARAARTPFLRGENDRGWKANPDWLLKPDSAVAVLEGKYDGTSRKTNGRAPEADKDWSGVPASQDSDQPFEAAL